MKAVVAAFNQEKALVGAFSVITNLRMELFEALASIQYCVSCHEFNVVNIASYGHHYIGVSVEWSWRVSILRDQIGQRYIRTPAGTLGLQNQLEINFLKVFGKLELGPRGFSPRRWHQDLSGWAGWRVARSRWLL